MRDSTEPHRIDKTPVRTLRADVCEGPDRGIAHVGSERTVIGTAPDANLVLTDPTVSRYHVELTPLADGIGVRDCGSTNHVRLGRVRIREAVVPPGTVLELGTSRVEVTNDDTVEVECYPGTDFFGIRAESIAMRRLLARVQRVATSNASVLFAGETGTGKELLARAVHEASPRAVKPFEVVDCSTLVPTLVASELFGHEKGAFTGAAERRAGAFERADGGTVFLDEIGELPMELQAQLLGVLERKTFRRVGGSRSIHVDVRIVSATHRDLRDWVNEGRFREDLYYRLAVARLEVPPLRERSEDIGLLVQHFIHALGVEPALELFPPDVVRQLETYRWPGNVRELRNFVECASAFGEIPSIQHTENTAQASASFLTVPSEELMAMAYNDARDRILWDFQRSFLTHLLQRHDQNLSGAARAAKMHRGHLHDLLRRHGLR